MTTIQHMGRNASLKRRPKGRLLWHPQQGARVRPLGVPSWAQQPVATAPTDTQQRTLADLIVRYQREVLPYKSSCLRFINNQKKQLNWWKEELGDIAVTDLTAAKIVEARSRLRVSSTTINHYMAALSHVFSIAVREWEWLELSPMRNIKRLKEPRGRVRYLSEAERTKLLDLAEKAGNYVLKLIIILALATGARKGELLHLKWGDVDWERARLTFQQTKNGERRSVYLGEHALQLLKAHYASQDHNAWVFPNRHGQPMRIDREFRALLELANIEDFRFHDLRHSAASYLAMNNATLIDIAEILGHKTLAMVKRYAHLSDSHTSHIITKMNSTIFQA